VLASPINAPEIYSMIGRREFIAGLGSAAAWPLAARAQQGERVRRIGVLSAWPEDDPLARDLLSILRQELQKMGWTEVRNLRIDVRFPSVDLERDNADAVLSWINEIAAYAGELIGLAPDLIFTVGSAATDAVQRQTRTIPIVFAFAGVPENGGPAIVRNIAHPEGNTTGFANRYVSLAGKWLELLKEAAPRLARVAVFPTMLAGGWYTAPIEAAATSYGIRVIWMPYHPAELERAIAAFAADPNGGLIVLPGEGIRQSRRIISRLAAQYRLPAIYQDDTFAKGGGLMSYGPNFPDIVRQTASYVDKILRGAKVGDLPVQFPTRFELVVNLKTAKAIGLTIPESFLVRTDAIIE
jgi:putative ABC transport system substrate-binding protein